jgi:hypothetical protein
MDADAVTALVAHVQEHIRDLPEVNTAATLRGLVGRVEDAVKHRPT